MYIFLIASSFYIALKENNCCLFLCRSVVKYIVNPLWVYRAVLLSYKCFYSLLCLNYNCIYLPLLISRKCKCCGEGNGKQGQKQTRQLCSLQPLKTALGHAMLCWNVSNTGSNV